MIQFTAGLIILTLVTLLIYLGLAQRVIDRMRLSHGTALIIMVLLIFAHFLPEISITPTFAIKAGALIPFGIVVYLLVTSSKKECYRALVISLVVSVILLLSDYILPEEPGILKYDIDPLYIPGILSGLISYITTRSRRSAFIGAIISVILSDMVAVIALSLKPDQTQIILGGGGIFDALIVNGIIAVIVAEVIGEIRERIFRGPAQMNLSEDGDEDE